MNGFKGLLRVTLVGCLVLCSCSPSPKGNNGGRLTAADFAPRPGERVLTEPSPTPPPSTDPSPPYTVTGPVAASEGILDVAARPGPPQGSGPQPEPVGGSVLVDIKIGDVNGKPIYANKFLEAMADHLRAKAADFEKQGTVQLPSREDRPNFHPPRMPWRQAWLLDTQMEINDRLESQVEDELLRAEAYASFTPDQRKGFFAFMQGLSDRMQSENQGSRSAASQRLAREKGLSMEDWLRAKEEENLVGFELAQRIQRRVNVTWRDIKQAYQQIQEKLEAGPALFHRIEVKSDNTAAIEEIKADLAKGTPFIEVARRPYNAFNPANAGLEEIKVTGSPASPMYYANAALNQAARTVQPGSYTGPVDLGGRLIWLSREDQKLPPLEGIVQLKIEDLLRNQRITYEKHKYIEQLKAKATVSSVQEMSNRLLSIAQERYLPRKAE